MLSVNRRLVSKVSDAEKLMTSSLAPAPGRLIELTIAETEAETWDLTPLVAVNAIQLSVPPAM